MKRLARYRHKLPRVRTRVVAVSRRGISATARAAVAEKHTLAAVGTAFAFGYLGTKTALPFIPALGPAGTYGLAFWMAGRWTKNRTLSHMATGLLCVQAAKAGLNFSMGQPGIAGDEDDIEV